MWFLRSFSSSSSKNEYQAISKEMPIISSPYLPYHFLLDDEMNRLAESCAFQKMEDMIEKMMAMLNFNNLVIERNESSQPPLMSLTVSFLQVNEKYTSIIVTQFEQKARLAFSDLNDFAFVKMTCLNSDKEPCEGMRDICFFKFTFEIKMNRIAEILIEN